MRGTERHTAVQQAGVWQVWEGPGSSCLLRVRRTKYMCFPAASAVGGRMWGSVTFHLALRGTSGTRVTHRSFSRWRIDFSHKGPSFQRSTATRRARGVGTSQGMG